MMALKTCTCSTRNRNTSPCTFNLVHGPQKSTCGAKYKENLLFSKTRVEKVILEQKSICALLMVESQKSEKELYLKMHS